MHIHASIMCLFITTAICINIIQYSIINNPNKTPLLPCLMKKVYDWDIGLTLKFQNNNKVLNMVCSIHTTIHQLKIEICKKLNLLVFDTEMDIYGGNNSASWRPMKSTSTLLQNGIEGKFAQLRVCIKRQKVNQKVDVRVEQQYDKKVNKNQDKDRSGCGLSLVASCTNQDCINYQQDTDIHVGYGTIPFYNLISSLKCEVCPYRSQYLRPSMMCKGIKMSYCNYKFQGTKTDSQGIPTQMSTTFYTIKQQKQMMKTITGKDWDRNIVILIKPL